MSLDTEFEGKPLLETLLEPTRIYVKEYKANKQHVKALAHITGGGIVENRPRVLLEGIKAVVKKHSGVWALRPRRLSAPTFWVLYFSSLSKLASR